MMKNDCLYCHKDIIYENFDLSHVHYCSDCVRICIECGEMKGIWCFNFDYTSDTYKEWKATNCYGLLAAPGHKLVCGQCEQKEEEAGKQVDPKLLQLMLKAVRK
jgi:hypothetical protein